MMVKFKQNSQKTRKLCNKLTFKLSQIKFFILRNNSEMRNISHAGYFLSFMAVKKRGRPKYQKFQSSQFTFQSAWNALQTFLKLATGPKDTLLTFS